MKVGKTIEKIAICLIFGIAILLASSILVKTFSIYSESQFNFSEEYRKAMSALSLPTDINKDSIELERQKIKLYAEYLDKLHVLHKNSSSVDLFVFLYGFLSSVLIGVSTFFAKNSKENTEKAREAAKSAQDALSEMSQNLETLKTDLKSANEQALLTATEIAGVKVDVIQAKTDVSNAIIEAKQAKEELILRRAEINKAEVQIKSDLLLLLVMQAFSLIQSCEIIIFQNNAEVRKQLDTLLPRLKRSWKYVEGQFDTFGDFTGVSPDLKEMINRLLDSFFTVLSNCHDNDPASFTAVYVERISNQIENWDARLMDL